MRGDALALVTAGLLRDRRGSIELRSDRVGDRVKIKPIEAVAIVGAGRGLLTPHRTARPGVLQTVPPDAC